MCMLHSRPSRAIESVEASSASAQKMGMGFVLELKLDIACCSWQGWLCLSHAVMHPYGGCSF